MSQEKVGVVTMGTELERCVYRSSEGLCCPGECLVVASPKDKGDPTDTWQARL